MRELFDMIFCLPTKTFTLVSVLLGFILIDDLNALEQNSLGNFLMTIGQILEAASAQEQLLQSKQPNPDISRLNYEIEKLKREIEKLKEP